MDQEAIARPCFRGGEKRNELLKNIERKFEEKADAWTARESNLEPDSAWDSMISDIREVGLAHFPIVPHDDKDLKEFRR